MSELQFNHFAPDGVGVHVARARVAGKWRRPLDQMADEIAMSAQLLADCGPDLIVFHCTDTSMAQGPDGEGRILDIIRDATGVTALATSRLVLEALKALRLKKLVVLSPYPSNENVIRYLRRHRHHRRPRRGARPVAARVRDRHAARLARPRAPRTTGRTRTASS